jgi:hypothetical protein
MTIPALDLRDILTAAIIAAKDAETLPQNNFEVKKSYLPSEIVTELPANGLVTVIALGWDEELKSRNQTNNQEPRVQVAFQKGLQNADVDTIDPLVILVDALRYLCKSTFKTHAFYTWMRTDTLKDENGTPFHFVGLRESLVFEAMFTLTFQVTMEG